MFIRYRVKPIFHQNAKYLASGTFASPNAKYTTFALPNAKNTNMLVSLALGDANISRFTRRVLPDAFYPTRFIRRVLPDASQWNIGGVGPSGVGAGVGHVHFIFFVSISFAFCSRRKPVFRWNMGFKFLWKNISTLDRYMSTSSLL